MILTFTPIVGSPIANVVYDTDKSQIAVTFRDTTVLYHYPATVDSYQRFMLAERAGDYYRYNILGTIPQSDTSL